MSQLKKTLGCFTQKLGFCVFLKNLGAVATRAPLLRNSGLSLNSAAPFRWDVYLQFTSSHMPYFIHLHFLLCTQEFTTLPSRNILHKWCDALQQQKTNAYGLCWRGKDISYSQLFMCKSRTSVRTVGFEKMSH